MLEHLAAKGIKRVVGPPKADVEICKRYHPEAVGALAVVAHEYGFQTNALFMKEVVPDWLVSGYRDMPADPQVKNSPHYFGVAFDVMVGSNNVIKQIEFIKLAVIDLQLFNRGGIYVGRNTCHIDRCDDEWIRTYRGAKFWVWFKNRYIGFSNFNEASRYALKQVTPGD